MPKTFLLRKTFHTPARHRVILIALWWTIFCFISGCDRGSMTKQSGRSQLLDDIPHSQWNALSSKRILFGHQSVGNNILTGIENLIFTHTQIKLTIFQMGEADSMQKPGLYHFGVGRNGDPGSKIDDFVKRFRTRFGNHVDVAFFKFCYVDMDASTDTGALFRYYQQTMADLKRDFPKTRFLHITVPLVAVQTGPKAWIKRIVGKTLYGTDDNYRRNEFNKLLLEAYAGKEPVFDLAKAESTFPNGTRSKAESGGKEFFVLAPEYTSDGGHLNATGRAWVAAEFLRFLASN